MNKQNISWEDYKEGIYGFLNSKSSKLLKETNKRAYTTANANWQLIQSVQIL